MARILHISDLHFGRASFRLKQFTSKRWLGNLNYLLFRQFQYSEKHLMQLPSFVKSLNVDWICATGDFSTTARPEEFERALNFLQSFSLPFLTLPGNHDMYTKEAEKNKVFYQFFPDDWLKSHRVSLRPLKNGWWWIGLDCAHATSVFLSNGTFSAEMESVLESFLHTIPAHDRVVLANHFPLHPSGDARHDLANALKLKALLSRFPQVKIYLHGHNHQPHQDNGHPIIFNAGCAAEKHRGRFYLIDLEDGGCSFSIGTYADSAWRLSEKQSCLFD